MIKLEQNITYGTKEGQTILLSISIALFIIFLFFFLFDQTFSMFILIVIQIALLFIVNFSFRNFYDVKLENEYLIFENLWNTRKVLRDELTSIRPHIFFFPYPRNPFFDFHFVNEKKITTKLTFSSQVEETLHNKIASLYKKVKGSSDDLN